MIKTDFLTETYIMTSEFYSKILSINVPVRQDGFHVFNMDIFYTAFSKCVSTIRDIVQSNEVYLNLVKQVSYYNKYDIKTVGDYSFVNMEFEIVLKKSNDHGFIEEIKYSCECI